MNLFLRSILVLIVLCTGLNVKAQTTVLLKGTVIDRTSDTIYVKAKTTSIRQEDQFIYIPIVDKKFEYKLNVAEIEALELIFLDERNKGVWQPILFFPDTSVISFTLYPMIEAKKNKVVGGSMNTAYYALQSQIAAKFKVKTDELSTVQKKLNDAGNFRSREYEETMIQWRKTKSNDSLQPIYKKMDELKKTGAEFTPAGQQYQLRADSLDREKLKMKYAYISKNINLVAYYLLWEDAVRQAKENRDIAVMVNKLYPVYKAKFPNHIYTKRIGEGLGGIVQIFPGNKFVDFTAPTLGGKEIKLSDAIKGKVALIDLWGSWCGPCIANAKTMVPIYKKYKDKGFTVVGVAREFKNTDALVNRLKQEEFNWLNLVELDDKNGIWNKYSAGDGGGVQVLVDTEGTIVAVNPTAKEVETFIKKTIGY